MAIVKELHRIGMRKCRRGLDLALEAAQVQCIAGPLGLDELERAGSAQQNMFGQIDLAHAAYSQTAFQLVGT